MRIVKKIRDSLQLACLGASVIDRCSIFFRVLFLPLYRRIGYARKELHLNLAYAGRPYTVVLNGSHDELLICNEIIVNEGYALPPITANVIIDAGANIGLASVYFAVRYTDARIISIEPSQVTAMRLRTNTKQFSNVTVIEGALTAQSGPVTFYEDVNKSIAASLTNRGSDFTETRVQGTTLTELCSRHQIVGVDVLKFDIEGAEYDVIASLMTGDTLLLPKYLVGEFHEDLSGRTIADFESLLTPHYDVTIQPAGKVGRFIVRAQQKSYPL